MKFNKILLILIIFSSITGCTINYDLEINKDGRINEIIKIDNKNKLNITNMELNNMIDNYKTSDLYKKYYITQKNNLYTANYIYNDIEDLKSNSNFSKNLEYIKNGDIININYKLNLSEYFLPDVEDYSVSLIDKINLSIKLPYKIIECNGKIIENNNCLWEFDSNKYEENIYLKYSTDFISSINSSNSKYTIIVLILLIGIGVYGIIYLINKSKNSNKL